MNSKIREIKSLAKLSRFTVFWRPHLLVIIYFKGILTDFIKRAFSQKLKWELLHLFVAFLPEVHCPKGI